MREEADLIHSQLQERLGVLLRGHDIGPSPYSASMEHSGGRPRYIVTHGQLERLLSLNFTKSRISELLGISRTTLWRRMKEHDIELLYSDVTEDSLDDIIKQYRRDHPYTGYYYFKSL